MQNMTTTASNIAEYFTQQHELMKNGADVITAVVRELSASQQFVNNKAIILKLLEKLESETDEVKLDIYRQALEAVVQRTPDDIIS